MSAHADTLAIARQYISLPESNSNLRKFTLVCIKMVCNWTEVVYGLRILPLCEITTNEYACALFGMRLWNTAIFVTASVIQLCAIRRCCYVRYGYVLYGYVRYNYVRCGYVRYGYVRYGYRIVLCAIRLWNIAKCYSAMEYDAIVG